ncbi:MAG: GIY-YIG nuclease family protein [Sulfuritalea sp.]|nr:GIY-YIG nuclease family protein [Sulfuritalea sp.]
MTSSKSWFVYLIECVDGSLYTGITVDLEARFQTHLRGKGARYTRSHPPLRILGAEAHQDHSSALKAERRIKQLTPTQKRAHAAQMSVVSTALEANKAEI